MALSWCRCNAYLSPKKKDSPPSSSARKSKYTGQSVREIPIRILTVGKKRSQGIQLLVEEFKEKIKYYCSIEDVLIRSNPKITSDVKAQIEAEDTVMMQQIKPEDLVVMLDENGKDIVSEQMADLIGDAGSTGSSRLTFCIGGPYGHGAQVRERADLTIRLSSMVLNHQVALVVLLEQLYRMLFGIGPTTPCRKRNGKSTITDTANDSLLVSLTHPNLRFTGTPLALQSILFTAATSSKVAKAQYLLASYT